MDIVYRDLQWPAGWGRANPDTSRYRIGFGKAHGELLTQLEGMQVQSVVITSMLPRTQAGVLRAPCHTLQAGQRGNYDARWHSVSGIAVDGDPGVAIYFDWQVTPRVFACDAWTGITDNLRAIGVTLESIRRMQRAGAGQLMGRVFSGFTALPASASPSNTVPAWCTVLGVHPSATLEEIRIAYRRCAFESHPDRGGSASRMHTVARAYDEACRAKGAA